MAFLPLPADSRGRSMSAPSLVPPPGPGPKWLSPVLPTPPDSDDDAKAAPPRKRPARQFAVFELGFMPLMSTEEPPKVQLCYEELEEEPQLPPTPRVTLKDGRELRPLLKHRKRSASHNVPQSARWGAALTRTPSSVSISTPSNENLDDDKPASEHEPEPEHPHEHEHSHVHFSEALENVCVFDEAAPAHDADPTHSPLPDKPCLQPPPSPRTRTCRQLRLPSTVIASSIHKAALGFDSSEPNSPSIPSPAPLSARGDMRLTLACDAALPSPQNAPRHGMFTTLGMQISPSQNALTGVVRARNIAFEKRVWVLYSVDDWRTQREAEGTWTDAYREGKGDIPARPDGYDDFEISIPLMELGIQGSVGTAVRARILHFAIGYSVPDKGEWWDNRDGANWVARFRAVCPGSFA